MEIDYTGKTVFITGASRGIGQAIANSFVEAGACVIAPKRKELDLSDQEKVDKYLREHTETNASVFVFCAGMNPKSDIDHIVMEDVKETFQVNLFSTIQIIKQYIPVLKKNKKGKIIFITSLYASVSREERSSYTSSKHAITGLMKTLALELAPYNICVNAVAPGYVMTEMTKKNLSEKEIMEIQEKIPTKRFQKAEEIASAVLFLGSDKNESITGQTINIEGGFLCI